MIAFLALLPCAVAVISVLVLRQSGLSAAVLAFVTALFLWASGALSNVAPSQLSNAIADALVLELLVGSVIFLGLLFVEVAGQSGGLDRLGSIVKTLELPTPRVVILVALGIGVTVESLTGYGISLFVTIPLLLKIMDRKRAIGLALIGMSLMTWGALSVAALLGAAIADVPLKAFAATMLITSGPVAAMLPLCCVLLVSDRQKGDLGFAVLAGVALVLGIAATTRFIGVEVAGVGGGLAVIILCMITAPRRMGFSQVFRNPALLPYGLLIVAVVAQKLVVPYVNAQGFAPVVQTVRVTFDVLASPGLALGLVSVACLAFQQFDRSGMRIWPLCQRVGRRSWRALLSIFFFLLSARLLVEIGGDQSLAQLLSQLGQYRASAAITLLGGFGAYAAGSGVASNALFMPGAVATGHSFDASVIFAAMQHSGASHMAMASLPVIAILLAALPEREQNDERVAMGAGLKLATLWLAMVIVSGWVLLWVRG